MYEDLEIELEKGPNGRMREKKRVEPMSGTGKTPSTKRTPGGGGLTINMDNSSINVSKIVINNNNEMPADYQKVCDENE